METRRVANTVSCLIFLLCITILFYMGITALLYTFSINKVISLIFVLVFTLVIVTVSIKINNYNKKVYIIFLFIISFLAYFFWNIYAETKPFSDYAVILQGANEIINGTFYQESYNKASYFYFYNYQIGYTLYVALILKLFGNSLVWLKILEGTYLALTSFIINKIIEKTGQKNSAVIASILYALYIPNIIGVSVINNQHLSTLLLFLSLFYFINDTILSIVVSGFLLYFVQLIRPIAIIMIIAVLLLYTLRALSEKKFKKWLLRFVLFMMPFIIMTKVVDLLVIQYKIAPTPISSNNAKYFKFVLGLTGNGVYNIPTENARETQVYFDLKKLNFDYNKYNQACIEDIKNTLKDYPETFRYLKNKMLYFAGGTDNQYLFSLDNSKLNSYAQSFINLGQAQYIFLLLCAFGTLILKLRRSKTEINIFEILTIGFVMVHIFIEVLTRYRFELYAISIVIASSFLNEIYQLLSRFINRYI